MARLSTTLVEYRYAIPRVFSRYNLCLELGTRCFCENVGKNDKTSKGIRNNNLKRMNFFIVEIKQ